MLSEINDLRRKIHRLESDNGDLRKEIDNKRILEKENGVLKEQLEDANRELAVLRDYVYKLTDEDVSQESVSVDEMKECISKFNVIIVGGHNNWVSKLKKEFDNWIFVNPETSGTTDTTIIEKADYVYFFTDTISHSRYYQFLKVLREKKIAFGYIHGVNIVKNVRDIHRDLIV